MIAKLALCTSKERRIMVSLGGVLVLAFSLEGCSSSSSVRDQNWGSDIGRGVDAAHISVADASADALDSDDVTTADSSSAADTVDAETGDAAAAEVAIDVAATDGEAADGETMDGDAATAQYTGGSRAGQGAP